MLDYTRVAISNTVKDFKRLAYIFNISTQLLYIAYLVYALIADIGFFTLNIILLVLSAGYSVFYILTYGNKEIKQERRITARIYKCSVMLAKCIGLATTVYGIYMATEQVSVVTVVLAALTTVGWTLNVVITLVFYFLEAEARYLISAIEADSEIVTKPKEKITNAIRIVCGEEIEAPETPSKTRRRLDAEVAEFRAEREREKEAKKVKFINGVRGFFKKKDEPREDRYETKIESEDTANK